MLTNNINFKNFIKIQQNKKILKLFKELIKEDNEILNSFKKTYKNSYSKKDTNKLRKFSNYILIGMGGSILQYTTDVDKEVCHRYRPRIATVAGIR